MIFIQKQVWRENICPAQNSEKYTMWQDTSKTKTHKWHGLDSAGSPDGNAIGFLHCNWDFNLLGVWFLLLLHFLNKDVNFLAHQSKFCTESSHDAVFMVFWNESLFYNFEFNRQTSHRVMQWQVKLIKEWSHHFAISLCSMDYVVVLFELKRLFG